MINGYLNFIITKINLLSIKYFKWSSSSFNMFTVVQQFFLCLGAIISTNTRSIHWDVSSNILITFLGVFSLFLMHFYTDAVSFCTLLSVYSLCHGFISNICTNYLIELFNNKYRNFFYNFCYSFKIFGMMISCFIMNNIVYDSRIDNPSLYTIGLPVGELILTFLMFFNKDSLRVLFYNNEIPLLYEYLAEMDFIDEFTETKCFEKNLSKRNFILKVSNKLDINLDVSNIHEKTLNDQDQTTTRGK